MYSLTVTGQVRHKILGGESSFQYMNSRNGVTSILQDVIVTVEYYGANLATDDTIRFKITDLTDASLNISISNPLQIIPKDSFTIDRKQKNFHLSIRSDAVPLMPAPIIFNIGIVNELDILGSRHQVTIKNVPLNPAATTGAATRITHMSPGGDTTFLAPYIRDHNATQGRQVKVRYKIIGKLATDSTVALQLIVPSGSSIKPELVTRNFKVSAARTSELVPYEDSVYVNFNISSQKDFGEDEDIYISFENDNSERDLIRFSRQKLINPNKPFWIEIGANLDLVDGLEPNNFFTGVFFYKRDIKKFKSIFNGDHSNISIFAGIYESKASSDSSISKNDQSFRYFDRNATSLIRNDSFPIFTDTGRLRYRTVTKNVSLFFSPSIRLTDGSANSDGLHVFASLWVEMLWARKSIVSDASTLNRKDTLFVPLNQLLSYDGSPIAGNRYYDYRSQYIGIGLPIYMKDNDVNLFINPIFGLSSQKDIPFMQTITSNPDGNLFLVSRRRWNPFFITQFRLSEEKYGFAFTGEVRGFLLKDAKPQISLALTKKFDLNKFLEFK